SSRLHCLYTWLCLRLDTCDQAFEPFLTTSLTLSAHYALSENSNDVVGDCAVRRANGMQLRRESVEGQGETKVGGWWRAALWSEVPRKLPRRRGVDLLHGLAFASHRSHYN